MEGRGRSPSGLLHIMRRFASVIPFNLCPSHSDLSGIPRRAVVVHHRLSACLLRAGHPRLGGFLAVLVCFAVVHGLIPLLAFLYPLYIEVERGIQQLFSIGISPCLSRADIDPERNPHRGRAAFHDAPKFTPPKALRVISILEVQFVVDCQKRNAAGVLGE